MLTQTRIRELAAQTVSKEGITLAQILNRNSDRCEGEAPDAANLCVLLEIFAERIEAARSEELNAMRRELLVAKQSYLYWRERAEFLQQQLPSK